MQKFMLIFSAIIISVFSLYNAKAEYINNNLELVKQGFLNTYFEKFVDKNKKINYDRDIIILNKENDVFAIYNKTIEIENENCIIIANLLNDEMSYFVIDKKLADFKICNFSDQKLYLSNGSSIAIFDYKKQKSNKKYFEFSKAISNKISYEQAETKLINDSLVLSTNYGGYKRNNSDGKYYSIIFIDNNNKKSDLKYLNTPTTSFFDFFTPMQTIAIGKSKITSVDNTNYNIFIYDKNCNPTDTINGKFSINHFLTDKEIIDFNKSIDYKNDQPGAIMKKTKQNLLWGKLNVIKRIDFVNDSTIFICYSQPKNTTTDDFETLFDNTFVFDIWQYIDNKWQIKPENKNLNNQTYEEAQIIDKNKLPIYDTYSIGGKYLYISSEIPVTVDKPISLDDYKKIKNEYYLQNSSPGAFFIYHFKP